LPIDGRIETDNNTLERRIRPLTLSRKNALFAGHGAGAEYRAVIVSPIETGKPDGVDPLAGLAGTLTAIVNVQKQSKIKALLPWNSDAEG
jgi:transposase